MIKKILRENDDLEWAKEIVQADVRPSRSLILKGQNTKLRNAIETHTEVMHGDGDSYKNEVVVYYKDAKGIWGKGYSTDEPNFEDFEKVVDYLRGNHQIDWEDDEETEFFHECGVIDYDEYEDNGYAEGGINKVFYYDEHGNKFVAKIDGVNTYHDDDEDDEDDDRGHEDECENCGDVDDTGTGICSDCEDDVEDECEICGDWDDTGTGVCSICGEEDDDDDEGEDEITMRPH